MEDKVINLNEQLNGIEKLFASGQIKRAQKDLRKLNSQFGREKPIPQKFRHKFQRLNFTAKEYDDWAEFATSDKRTELIEEVKNLASSKLEPRRLAEKIHSVQRQWQNLDQHGKTASKEKWSTFKEACQKAWLPCREYFEILDRKKDENRLKKLKLINQMESFPIGKSPEQITVIQIVNFLKSMHAKWKDCSPVPDADFQDLNKKFRDSREGVNDLLLSVEQYNKSLKEAIISEVQGLDFDDLDNSVLKIKELQEKWRTLGPAGKKLDPEINKNFDVACSKFLLEKDKELDESRGILETIIKDVRDESISTSEAEEKFKELTNLYGTLEEKRFKKAIKDFVIIKKNEKTQEKLKGYQDLFKIIFQNGPESLDKKQIPDFITEQPENQMDVCEASIRFQMFAGLDPVGPKELVSKIKFEELKNRFSEKTVNQNEYLIKHFTNIIYSKRSSNNQKNSDMEKATLKALKKVENLLP